MYRKIYEKLVEILSIEKIVFIVWPRQVGKTTFLRKIYDTLDTQNKQFLNLENFEYHSYFHTFSNFQSFVRSSYSGEGKYYLFLDEFQKAKGIDTILKLISDEMPYMKVILSWSNNIEINKNIKESFAWRKRVYSMWPLDFDEFLIWREGLEIEELAGFKKNILHKKKIWNYAEEFMVWWGYPEVVLETDREKKKQILSDIFDFWFNRDIVLYTSKMYEFKELTKQLGYRLGQTLNFAELASLTHVSAPTIKAFISVLEETFIVFTQKPFFRNKLKEINKSPKLYFYDFWFRNWFINRFDFSPDEKWYIFENMMLWEFLKRDAKTDIKFWRTNDEQYEVDLILEDRHQAYEIKYKENLKESDSRWIHRLESLYPEFHGNIVYKENFYTLL